MDVRVCSECGETKPLSGFYLDRGKPRGNCKVCHKAVVLRRQRENPDRYAAYQEQYRTAHRAKARATTVAWKKANPVRAQVAQVRFRADPKNQAIARARTKAFRLANPHLIAAYARTRYARKKAATVIPVTAAQLATKAAYWDNRCWLCRGPHEAWDHVKPLSKHGPHMLANLRPACNPCNQSKSDRWPFAPAFA